MKRIFALLLSLAVLFSCLAVTAGAMFDPSTVYDVKAQSAYIVNTDTNIIVYEKDSEKQVSAGGLTKYMTIALVLTNYADQLDSTFTMPFAISDYVHNSDNADMRSGETFTYREALYAMVTRNANEAAMGLAYELSGGDLAGWVSQMNTLSQRIGTTSSTWEPTVWPARPCFHPLITPSSENVEDLPRSHEESNCVPSSSQPV